MNKISKKKLIIKIEHNRVLLGLVNFEKKLNNFTKIKKNLDFNKKICVSNFFFFFKKKIVKNTIEYLIDKKEKLKCYFKVNNNIRYTNYRYLIIICLLLVKKMLKNGLIGFF